MQGRCVFEPLYENLTENTEVVLTKQEHITKLQFCKTWNKKKHTKKLLHNKMLCRFSKSRVLGWPTQQQIVTQRVSLSTVEKISVVEDE